MVVVVVVVVSIWYFLAPAEEHMTLRSALCRSRCDGGGGGGGGERPQQLIKPKSLSVSQTIASCQLPFFYFLVCYMLQDGKYMKDFMPLSFRLEVSHTSIYQSNNVSLISETLSATDKRLAETHWPPSSFSCF